MAIVLDVGRFRSDNALRSVGAVVLVCMACAVGCDPAPDVERVSVTTVHQIVRLDESGVASGTVKVTAKPSKANVYNAIRVTGASQGQRTRIRVETWSARLSGPHETVTPRTTIQAPRQEFDITDRTEDDGPIFVETSDRPPCDACEFEFRYRITHVGGDPANLDFWADVSHALHPNEIASAQLDATLVPS